MQTPRPITQFIAYGVGAIALMVLAGFSGVESGTGSSSMAQASTPSPKDGELALPGEYKSWPKFLSEVQRPDTKQVRELYINPAGAKTSRGQAFPSGTVMVMELYKAQLEGETPVTGADGKLVKGTLAKVFVMGKGDGWGQDVPEQLRNGAWVFSAYGPDGKSLRRGFHQVPGLPCAPCAERFRASVRRILRYPQGDVIQPTGRENGLLYHEQDGGRSLF